jgi:GxxExxY protein
MELLEYLKYEIQSIYEVLGDKQDEDTYKKALEVSFMLDKHKYDKEKYLPIYYREHIVSYGNADFVIYEGLTLIIEVKTESSWLDSKSNIIVPPPVHLSQIKGYMKSIATDNGILINFPKIGSSTKKTYSDKAEYIILPNENKNEE